MNHLFYSGGQFPYNAPFQIDQILSYSAIILIGLVAYFVCRAMNKN